MAKCRIDDAWRIGFCWCPARAESSLLYNTYSFQKFHEQMRTIPGVTTRLFEEPIECSRTLPVMRSIPKRKVVRKYDRVSQYTNEPPTLGYIVQQNRRAKRNPMLMGDGRWTNGMECPRERDSSCLSLFYECYWASLNVSMSSCPQWNSSLPTSVTFIM